MGQQGGRVQKVEPGHLAGFCNGGQVHHLVLLQEQVTVLAQPVNGLRGRGQAHLLKAGS